MDSPPLVDGRWRPRRPAVTLCTGFRLVGGHVQQDDVGADLLSERHALGTWCAPDDPGVTIRGQISQPTLHLRLSCFLDASRVIPGVGRTEIAGDLVIVKDDG